MRPLPRYRLYADAAMYRGCLTAIALGRAARGEDDQRLEDAMKTRTGATHAICMPTATAAMFLVLRAMVRPGQKVILSPYTISDVVNMVLCADASPVFADIDRATCHIRTAELERVLDRDVGGVIVTHLHGCACEMDDIVALCRSRGVPVIEDAAQAFGARYRGRAVGTFGDAGIFSFGMYKNVNAFLGGMVITSRSDLHERLRREVRSLPYQDRGAYARHVLFGLLTDVATLPSVFARVTFPLFRLAYLHDVKVLNRLVSVETTPKRKETLPDGILRRMLPLQARLILAQLGRVDADSDRRIAFARIYYDGLKDIPELIVAPWHDDRSHIYTYFPVQPPDRTALLRWMMRRGCDVAASHLK
ncbi:MAG: DegT/DnrJ/EryC1/StrS family aminotransferase, partial [Vicinamibacterales bacterium]